MARSGLSWLGVARTFLSGTLLVGVGNGMARWGPVWLGMGLFLSGTIFLARRGMARLSGSRRGEVWRSLARKHY